MNKAVLAAALCLHAFSLQAVPISSIVTGTADIVFRETGTAAITVSPVSALQAGVHNARVIATAVASATGGTVAYRWSPAGSEGRDGSGNQRILTGKSTPDNRLQVSSVAPATLSPDFPGWYVADNGAGRLDISVLTAAGNQAVAADTYIISLDAAVWSE
ncbi:TPA: hypothetical protein O8L60_004596 [Enterobacter cloacae]|nr:hypothetical protein [Enterobacter cloacae]